MSEIPPAIPFHLARTYGASSPTLATGRRTVLPSIPVDAGVRQAPARVPSQIVSRLVAARVAGGIDFVEDAPQPTRSGTSVGASLGTALGLGTDAALPFYRHPADKNAAATSIALAGRSLDTTA